MGTFAHSRSAHPSSSRRAYAVLTVPIPEASRAKPRNQSLTASLCHNPELAEDYATRIVRVKDGHIVDDTAPFYIEKEKLQEPQHKNMGKSSMSILTALSLSFNNLRTKKGRTFLTAFAGSIGIIGIALILSFSNGVNTYIEYKNQLL